MNSSVRRVVIVGAGIGGPVLGMWLKRLGVDVVCVEARPSAAMSEGAFLGVAPNGMNVLDSLGLAELVAAQGHACDAFRFTNNKSQRIGFIDRSQDTAEFRWPLTMIRRGKLHTLLAEEAERRGVDLHFGKRLYDIDRSRSSEVVARFNDGSEESGDLLVGADGLRSTVRSLAVPDAPKPKFSGLLDCGGFVSSVRVPFPARVNEMVFGRRAFFGAFTTPAGETWWFHNGPAADRSAPDDTFSKLPMRERLLDLHRDDPTWISDLIRATPEILGPWPLYDLYAMPRWIDDRVCLIGDAAHAMSPSAGQGASLAMEDAMVLAQCLRDIADPVTALRTFEKRRRPRVEAIFNHARRSSSGKAMGNALSEWFRDRLLPVFLKLGASAQAKAYGYRISWEDSIAATL